jgi:hypothetical protein
MIRIDMILKTRTIRLCDLRMEPSREPNPGRPSRAAPAPVSPRLFYCHRSWVLAHRDGSHHIPSLSFLVSLGSRHAISDALAALLDSAAADGNYRRSPGNPSPAPPSPSLARRPTI